MEPIERIQHDLTLVLGMVKCIHGDLNSRQLQTKIAGLLKPGCVADLGLLGAAVHGKEAFEAMGATEKRSRENAITYAMRALARSPTTQVVKVHYKLPPATGRGRTGDSATWRQRFGIVLSTIESVFAMVTTTNLPQPNLCIQLPTTNLPHPNLCHRTCSTTRWTPGR